MSSSGSVVLQDYMIPPYFCISMTISPLGKEPCPSFKQS